MIGELRGRVSDVDTSCIILDVSGVGYIVSMPLSDLSNINVDDIIHVYTIVIKSESTDSIIGFLSKDNKLMAARLIKVQGVGQRAVLSCIAKIPFDAWSSIVDNGDISRLKSVPGIGEKTAQKIILELKGKLSINNSSPEVHADAKLALLSLGFSSSSINKVLVDIPSTETTQNVIKTALNLLTRGT